MSKSRETYKRKETERKHILSVSIEISDIESSHCTASAEHGWFIEHPFKAVGDLRALPQRINHLDGTNLAYSLEYDKKFSIKFRDWAKTEQKINELDLILFLEKELCFRNSKKNEENHKSVYKEIQVDGKKLTIRVSDHHYINTQYIEERHVSSITLTNKNRERLPWNKFKTLKEKVVEYTYNIDNFDNEKMIELLKSIQFFLKTGEYKCSLPHKVKKSDSYKQWEQRKLEKKGMHGMGATKFTDIAAKVDEIINLHKEKEYPLTKEEREVLRSYGGHGGENEFDRGMLDEYYTPPYVCKQMFELAKQYGYTKGKVLEPSCAIGNMIEPIYDTFEYTAIDAFEISERTKAICKLLYPKVTIYGAENQGFETAFLQPPRYTIKVKPKEVTWLKNYPYDLVIGNPPYGNFTTRYSSYFKGCQRIEMFFIEYCLKLLRKDGLLVFITQDNLLSSGFSYQIFKERILDDCEFLDAYRMPSGLFDKTEVVTDIIVLKKK
jgi:type I restriction-modification system DNA methylase subunit